MKKRIWKLHSVLGLTCGLGLLVIGLTGSVLVFHKEIEHLFFGRVVASSDPSGERLPLPQLVKSVRAAHPDFWIAGWLPNRDPAERDIAYLKRVGSDDWHKLRVDQYTGEMVTAPLAYRDTLDGWLVELHYTFFADHAGMALTAFFALGLIALSATGFWIHRRFWKNLFRLRWKASARILFSDAHKAIGIASAPLNLLLGFTGAYWNIAHLVHEAGEHGEEAPEAVWEPLLETRPLQELIATTERAWPTFQLNYIYFPTTHDPNTYFYGYNPSRNPLHSPYGSWMGVDSRSGEVAIESDLRSAGLWANAVDAFEPLHFGDFGGLASKTIWCVAGLAPAGLALSGAALFWARQRRSAASPSAAGKDRARREPEPANFER